MHSRGAGENARATAPCYLALPERAGSGKIRTLTTRIDRYEIGARLATGGMAEIFAARAVGEHGLAKRVALKRVLAGYSADTAFVQRFLHEARLAMRLGHANVVQVFDFGRTADGQYFLAMEFVDGVDLLRLIERAPGQPLEPAEAIHIACCALRGLDYAHRATDEKGQPLGIVHRDIKPANLLISFEGEVRITDFGIARSLEGAGLTQAGGLCGTIAYMSPEQARGEPVDLRSDVFSVGTLLYLLATGIHPFAVGDSDFATLDAVRGARPRPPSAAGAALPKGLEAAILCALSADRDQRFASAGAFADRLEEVAHEAGLPSGVSPLRRRLRAAFPTEEDRLRACFSDLGRKPTLIFGAQPTVTGMTELSRVSIPAHEDAVLPAARGTIAMGEAPAVARRGVWLGIGLLGGFALVGGLAVARRHGEGQPPKVPFVFPKPPPRGVGSPAAAPAPPPASAAVPAPAPVAEKREEPRPARAAEHPRKREAPRPPGAVTVNALPWANVILDGHVVGTTPLIGHAVPSGKHVIVVENPELGRRKRFVVDVQPNQTQKISTSLREEE